MRLSEKIRGSGRRFRVHHLMLMPVIAWILLGTLAVVILLRILRPWILPSLDWLNLTVVLIALLIVTELTFRFLLRARWQQIAQDQTGDFRMDPHPFVHFVPSTRYPDVHPHGFRMPSGGQRLLRDAPSLYLTGDCTLFEEHLPQKETFAYHLGKRIPELQILNAGTDHYTALHSYNRFVLDILRGYRPQAVLFFSATNDCLSFIHHKEGVVKPDHSHMYRPWLSLEQVHGRLRQVPTATLRYLFLQFLIGREHTAWDTLAEDISPTFQDPRSVAIAHRLFNPEGFRTCLRLFQGACETIGSKLVLTTCCYQPWDMLEEPRQTYAWGIDRLNDEIRAFARSEEVTLIDLAEEMVIEGGDILNKWHFTLSGNRKRTEIVSRYLRQILPLRPEAIHAPLS